MKRREFIVGLTSTAGLISMRRSAAVEPCPPIMDVAGATPACPSDIVDSDLATAAAQLSIGEFIEFVAGRQSAFSTPTLEWQSNFYHDPANNVVHLLGKPANANSAWQHQYFTISTSQWTNITGTSGIGNWSYYGHIYGNTAFDETTGDLYQTVGIDGSSDSKKAWRFRRSTGRWDRRAPESGTYTSTALNDTCNGAAWHPNLFGPGDPGLVIDQQVVTLYWRKATDTMYQQSHTSNAYGRKEGIGIYWPAQDVVIVGGSTGDALARVESNGAQTPIRTNLNPPPITTSGQSSLSSTFGSLHVHPGNPNKLLLVETVGPRAWTSMDGNNWTRIGDHPFNRKPRVVCSLRNGLGCLWAIGNDGSNFSQLWKPAS